MGKSFEYWKNLYDEGIIDRHAIHLRLNHLKYAFDHNLITKKEYYELRLNITDQCSPSYTDYKPCSLLDFSKALNSRSLTDKFEKNKPLIIDKHSEELICKVQKNIINTSGNINQQNGLVVDVYEHNLDKEKGINNDIIKMQKKSRKKRKRKKKFKNNDCILDYNNTSKTVVTEFCDEKMENSSKNKNYSSKNSVKIYVRQMNNNHKSKISSKESLISTEKSLKNIFSKMLKQFKKERQLKC